MSSGSTTTALVAAATAFVVVLAVAACAVAVIAPLRRKLFPPRERGAVAAGHTDRGRRRRNAPSPPPTPLPQDAAAGLFLEASTDGEMCIVRDGKQPWPQALWGRSRAALVEDGASILQRRLPDIDVSTAAFSEVFSSAIAASSTGTAHSDPLRALPDNESMESRLNPFAPLPVTRTLDSESSSARVQPLDLKSELSSTAVPSTPEFCGASQIEPARSLQGFGVRKTLGSTSEELLRGTQFKQLPDMTLRTDVRSFSEVNYGRATSEYTESRSAITDRNYSNSLQEQEERQPLSALEWLSDVESPGPTVDINSHQYFRRLQSLYFSPKPASTPNGIADGGNIPAQSVNTRPSSPVSARSSSLSGSASIHSSKGRRVSHHQNRPSPLGISVTVDAEPQRQKVKSNKFRESYGVTYPIRKSRKLRKPIPVPTPFPSTVAESDEFWSPSSATDRFNASSLGDISVLHLRASILSEVERQAATQRREEMRRVKDERMWKINRFLSDADGSNSFVTPIIDEPTEAEATANLGEDEWGSVDHPILADDESEMDYLDRVGLDSEYGYSTTNFGREQNQIFRTTLSGISVMSAPALTFSHAQQLDSNIAPSRNAALFKDMPPSRTRPPQHFEGKTPLKQKIQEFLTKETVEELRAMTPSQVRELLPDIARALLIDTGGLRSPRPTALSEQNWRASPLSKVDNGVQVPATTDNENDNDLLVASPLDDFRPTHRKSREFHLRLTTSLPEIRFSTREEPHENNDHDEIGTIYETISDGLSRRNTALLSELGSLARPHESPRLSATVGSRVLSPIPISPRGNSKRAFVTSFADKKENVMIESLQARTAAYPIPAKLKKKMAAERRALESLENLNANSKKGEALRSVENLAAVVQPAQSRTEPFGLRSGSSTQTPSSQTVPFTSMKVPIPKRETSLGGTSTEQARNGNVKTGKPLNGPFTAAPPINLETGGSIITANGGEPVSAACNPPHNRFVGFEPGRNRPLASSDMNRATKRSNIRD